MQVTTSIQKTTLRRDVIELSASDMRDMYVQYITSRCEALSAEEIAAAWEYNNKTELCVDTVVILEIINHETL